MPDLGIQQYKKYKYLKMEKNEFLNIIYTFKNNYFLYEKFEIRVIQL